MAELDSWDVVEGLVIRGGMDVEVLNVVSLHGHLAGSWPMRQVTAQDVVPALEQHWRAFGLPHYAQFDNDTLFQGAHQHRDSISRVMRLCLSLKVTPVFAVPMEHGFQGAIENYNGRWQEKVWARFQHQDLPDLSERSRRYVAAHRARTAPLREHSPRRRAFPDNWALDLQAHPRGRLVYLRRTNEAGDVALLGRRFLVTRYWPHRMVRCEVDLDHDQITFHRLRRADPEDQPVLGQVPYTLPKRRFHEKR